MLARDCAGAHARIDHVRQDLERHVGRHADSPHYREAMEALTRAMEAVSALGADLLEQEGLTD